MPHELLDLTVEEVSSVDEPANMRKWLIIKRAAAVDDVNKAEWSTAMVNDFPDSSFAHISPGGTKDDEGKTTPRNLRHLPYKDASGKPDVAHTRNALARLSQTDIPAADKAKAKKKLLAAARTLGIKSKDLQKDVGLSWESNGDDDEDIDDLDDRLAHEALWQQWGPLWHHFCDVVYACMDRGCDDPDTAQTLMDSIETFAERAEEIFDGLDLLKRATPPLTALTDLTKAGRVMAADRQQKLEQALSMLHEIMDDAQQSREGSMPQKNMGALKTMMDKGDVTLKDMMAMPAKDAMDKLGCTMKDMLGHMGYGVKDGMEKAGAADMPAMMGMPMKALMAKLGLSGKDFEDDDEGAQTTPQSKRGGPMSEPTQTAQIAALRKRLKARRDERKTARATGEVEKAAALTEQIKALEGEIDGLLTPPGTDPAADEVWKGVHPTVRKEFEDLRKRTEDAELRAATADRIAKAEREQRERTEYISKAASAPYRQLGVVADDWEHIKALESLPEASRTYWLTKLRAAGAQLEDSGLLKAAGFDKDPNASTSADDAEGQIHALAKKYAADNKCDLSTAIDAVMKDEPALWERYTLQKRQQTRLPLKG